MGRDTKGPTAAANSVAHLNQKVCHGGVLYNLRIVPSAGGSVAALTDFPDAVNVSDYALDALSVFVENGIVTGSGGMLRPGDGTTRAQMAQTFYNLLSA